MGHEPAQKIEFRPSLWDSQTEDHFALIDGLTPGDISFYREQVANNHRRHMAVYVGGERVGSLIWSVSDEPSGRWFILDEMGAHNRRVDLIAATVKMARVVCQEIGADHMRFFTRRRGFLRKMPAEFEVSYIMEAPA